jgi:hypothetical protein
VTADGALEDELRSLRRGEGIYAADVGLRLGPALRRLAAVADDDATDDVRHKLATWIDAATERLDPDSRLAVRAAFGVLPNAHQRFFGERLAWLAAEWRCDQRTARRRVDRAFRLLAVGDRRESTPDHGRPVVSGWSVVSLVAMVRMDLEPPEAIELRRVVATVDKLTELVTSVSLPRHPDDHSESHGLRAELLFGGRLERWEQPYTSYFQNVIALASPLPAGAEHEYAIRLTMPPGQPMAPHYVHQPAARTDYFSLHVRFAPDRIPRRVWRLTGVPPVVVHDPEPNNDLLAVDRFGEVRCEFRDLVPGHGYGISWQPA